jgi:hypothetical protein
MQQGANAPSQMTRVCSAVSAVQRFFLATRAAIVNDSHGPEAASPESEPAGHNFFYLALRRFSFRIP